MSWREYWQSVWCALKGHYHYCPACDRTREEA